MGYQVKWVEQHIGVTRKALRLYEEKGLMPKNHDRKYRDYSEEDIKRIWAIKVFQGIGYTLNEIADMVNNEQLNFLDSLEKKIKKLEEEKMEKERHIGYAKTIKTLGCFPTFPKEMGNMKIEEFMEKSLEEWNLYASSETKMYQQLVECSLNKSEEEMADEEVEQLFELLLDLSAQKDTLLVDNVLFNLLVKRKELGATHSVVQAIIQLIYEERCETIYKNTNNVSPRNFAHSCALSFMEGDIAVYNEENYGKDVCEFVADAFAYFGGWSNRWEILGK